jgi:protein required for attachment to host cells
MNDLCIVVADAARARIFAVDDRDDGTGAMVPSLIEVEDLIDPTQKMRDGDIYSHSRPGLTREFAGGVGAAHDEHRADHAAEMERRFATDVITAAARVIDMRKARRVIVAADPRTLGFLRPQLAGLPRSVEIDELPKHLTQLAPVDLLAFLERSGRLRGPRARS